MKYEDEIKIIAVALQQIPDDEKLISVYLNSHYSGTDIEIETKSMFSGVLDTHKTYRPHIGDEGNVLLGEPVVVSETYYGLEMMHWRE